MYRRFTILAIALLLSPCIHASKLRVLFIGNSYTDVNHLPLTISNLALSAGDTLVYSSSAPGGYTFQQHAGYTPTRTLIAQGNWDYVVLQEQSQLPAFPDAQVATDVYPYARQLDSLIHLYSPCAKTVFYMTWGRKNGDASNCANFSPMCTYAGMDSMLQLRYTTMAGSNKAILSPVARVWKKLRQQSPPIELYQSDESHPTEAGTYAAACTFYSVLFGKNPAALTYNASLSAANATTIRNVAKSTAFDSLQYWKRFNVVPVAAFTNTPSGNTVSFNSQSQNAERVRWTFGDGTFSTLQNPQHSYTLAGIYNVCLTAYRHCDSNMICHPATIGHVGLPNQQALPGIGIYPNPAYDQLSVSGLTAEVHYILYDIRSGFIRQGILSPAAAGISLQGIETGIYFIRFADDNGQHIIRRFLITK